MKKKAIGIIFLLFMGYIQPSYGSEVSVDIQGSQELFSLKEGIIRTITARCLSKNISLEKEPPLNVSIMQLGETLSLDAILGTKPPRAFHKDLKNTGEISAAIDQMISEIFMPAPQITTPQVQQESSAPAPEKKQHTEINLPFVATSLVTLDDSLYVSSKDTLYRMEGTVPKPLWNASKDSSIFRLYTFEDSLLAVTNKANRFVTYLIKNGKIEKTWDQCVVTSGNALIASRLISDFDVTDGIHKWQKPEVIEGSSISLPEGIDILALAVSDVASAVNGEEVITFDGFRCLSIANGTKTIWKSDTRAGTLPLFMTGKRITSNNISRAKDPDQETRYYLMPRILVQGKNIITTINDEGLTRFLGNTKFYNGAHIIQCAPDQEEFIERDLSVIQNYYCADIALTKDSVLALVVKKSTSYIQRIDLK